MTDLPPSPTEPAPPPETLGRAAWRGAKAISPLLPGVFPFAIIAASGAVEVGLSKLQTVGLSVILFAGASQLVFIEMWDRQAPALVLLATVFLVNLRFTMYSATMAPHFMGLRTSRKAILAYGLTDQASLLSLPEFDKDPKTAKGFYAGAALTMWVTWQAGSLFGIFVGQRLPDSWSLDFAVPLSFIALMIPAIKDRGTAIAAVTAGSLMLVTRLLPLNLGLIVAALVGVAAGMLSERWG